MLLMGLSLGACRPPDVSDVTASIISGLFWPKLPEETVKLHPKVRPGPSSALQASHGSYRLAPQPVSSCRHQCLSHVLDTQPSHHWRLHSLTLDFICWTELQVLQGCSSQAEPSHASQLDVETQLGLLQVQDETLQCTNQYLGKTLSHLGVLHACTSQPTSHRP